MITPSLSARIAQVIQAWRHDALVAGQFSVEGEDGADQHLAAGQAMARTACADELESALAQGVQPVSGEWPAHCEQRAFVDGVAWWEFTKEGATIWASDRDRAETEAVRRYGSPALVSLSSQEPK